MPFRVKYSGLGLLDLGITGDPNLKSFYCLAMIMN